MVNQVGISRYRPAQRRSSVIQHEEGGRRTLKTRKYGAHNYRLSTDLRQSIEAILGQRESEIFAMFSRQVQEALMNRCDNVLDLGHQRVSRYGRMTFATRQTLAAAQISSIEAFFLR